MSGAYVALFSSRVLCVNYFCVLFIVRTLRGHEHSISALCFLGDFVFTCSRDHSVKAWEVASGYEVRTFKQHNDWVRCITATNHISSEDVNGIPILVSG